MRTMRFDLSKTLVLCAVLGIVLVVSLIVAFSFVRDAYAAESRSGRHVVTLYDNGVEKGFVTDKDTVKEALSAAGVTLQKNDITEPALSEKLVAPSYSVNIYRARPVLIVDGSSKIKIMSAYQTAKQIAEQANLAVHTEDKLSMELSDDVVRDGTFERVVINRATPVTFVFYGKTIQAYTHAKTVGAMLVERKIAPSKDDTLSPDIDTPITAGMKVELWRNGKQTLVQDEDIAFSTEKIQDANREIGYREIKTPGKNGKRTVTYEVVMKNGKEESRKEIKSVTISEPVKQVEVVGSKFSNTFNGSFAEALARLRSCEGSYTSNTGNGYYGAYQFDIQTWGGYQGFSNASQAPPAVQDQKAWETYQRRGWQPWPSCSRSQGLQDIYR